MDIKHMIEPVSTDFEKPLDDESLKNFDPTVNEQTMLSVLPVTQKLGNVVAAITETPLEAQIDAANGLRGHKGRRPTAQDFDGLLTPEGNSGDVFGTGVTDDPFVFGENVSTGGTPAI